MARLVPIATLVAILVFAGCGRAPDEATGRPTATVEPSGSPTAASADDLRGSWRAEPLLLAADLLEGVTTGCRGAAEAAPAIGLSDQPIVVADARGEAQVGAVLADEHAAFVCLVTLAGEDSGGEGSGMTILEPPTRLDPAAAPVEEGNIRLVVQAPIVESPEPRTLLIGRVGPLATLVAVDFAEGPRIRASSAHGWYLAWWPGTVMPSSVLALGPGNVAAGGVADPGTPVEGRVGPASWWIDPAVGRPADDATEVSAQVLERSCASGTPPEGRILDPEVFYGDEAVLVTFLVRRLTGTQTCEGNPPFPVRFSLAEPLGDRTLLDGGEVPPRDARSPGR